MKSVQVIIVTLLLSVVFTTNGYSQDKLGFTIQKVSMMGFEAKAMGTVTFNKSFTEMEIKQYIIPKDGKPESNPKYKTTRYKLDGLRMDGKGHKEFEGLDIVFTGAAIIEGEPNINVTVVIDNEGCSLEMPVYGYEASGKLLMN
jgi:hypothetical protein